MLEPNKSTAQETAEIAEILEWPDPHMEVKENGGYALSHRRDGGSVNFSPDGSITILHSTVEMFNGREVAVFCEESFPPSLVRNLEVRANPQENAHDLVLWLTHVSYPKPIRLGQWKAFDTATSWMHKLQAEVGQEWGKPRHIKPFGT